MILELLLLANLDLALLCICFFLRFKRAQKRIGHDAKTETSWFWKISGKVEKLVQRARRGGERIALVMFDIDYFKQVNDAHTDHQFGDRVLRELCQVILSVLRPFDLLSRYGGEEFVLVLALNDGKDSALTACERVRVAVEEHVFESGLRLTVSMGVAVCPDDGTALEDLIKRSDEAMYRAKAAGRNRVELA